MKALDLIALFNNLPVTNAFNRVHDDISQLGVFDIAIEGLSVPEAAATILAFGASLLVAGAEATGALPLDVLRAYVESPLAIA